MTALADEIKLMTSIGTRWAVPARVEILSGMFEGTVYDDVLIYTPTLKNQLSQGRPVEGRLGRGSYRDSGGVPWILRQS